jgi:RHS repeat-associated protein
LVQAGGVKLVYDGDGNRVKETVATTTTSYLVADQNLTGYAQVLDEVQGGTVSRTYSYGLELINETQSIAGASTTSFYGFDGHGSVRFLTDPTGTVTDTYDYDAFGNLIAQTGTTPNNYLFAGEQFDPALGIYYNRARYYDQRLGRFWTVDSAEGSQDEPATLHKYLYARDNPITFSDPSGWDFVSDFATGIAVQRDIGAQFRAQFGADGCVDRQIINILASDCGAPRDVGLPFPGGLRPDLANVRTGAVYEIKPIKSAAGGLLQLLTYRAILRLADPVGRNWHLGSGSEFTPRVVIRLGLTRVAYVAPPVLGVIVYFVADARDAFDLSLLLASRILPAVLGSQSAVAVAGSSNVISITQGVGIAGAAAQAEGAEIKNDVGTAILEDAA